ncbi:hypothetical protein MES4922_370030 [Mesorhizobium ventifaucium]|uniref:Uncharacterized protein n=1 Tax=Mesorhizobium ventifaucium TaxID=666020 RepID=A0ABN8K5S0_9HYPH|nr:hypothetical protein MES4922_370030 [Mesorhizobium ventifaucium]
MTEPDPIVLFEYDLSESEARTVKTKETMSHFVKSGCRGSAAMQPHLANTWQNQPVY